MLNPKKVRREVLDLIYKARTSHIGSNFSCTELLCMLYRHAEVPRDLPESRDRIILSKGWAAATAYVCLKEIGVLSEEDLSTFGNDGGLLGLVERSTPGIEASTGSMGHGLPIAVGMALAARRSNQHWNTYVLMSDGEMACGTTWESALIANHHKLSNLVVVVDRNDWQAMGRTDDVLRTQPLGVKWQAFGWNVIIVDGHNMTRLKTALESANKSGMPTVIIADTIKGKGVSFMEDELKWHYQCPSAEEYEMAVKELS